MLWNSEKVLKKTRIQTMTAIQTLMLKPERKIVCTKIYLYRTHQKEQLLTVSISTELVSMVHTYFFIY